MDGLTSALVALAEVSFTSEEMTWNVVLPFASQVLVDAAISGAFELTYDQITLVMDTVEKIAATQERVKNVYLTALNSTPTTHLHQSDSQGPLSRGRRVLLHWKEPQGSLRRPTTVLRVLVSIVMQARLICTGCDWYGASSGSYE